MLLAIILLSISLFINALDEIFRHSITIMSQLHFVSAKKYFNRVLQLGKDKKKYFFIWLFECVEY